uniref:hypothetical protein n=1 Tax=Piscinibacter defluvii TaxID=1796922 RepID=UPI00197CA2C8
GSKEPPPQLMRSTDSGTSPGAWKALDCQVVGVGAGDIDIAVLAAQQVISPTDVLEPTTRHIYLSQDAYFLGFPYGLHAEVGALNAQFPIPLVKRGCVSQIELVGGGARYLLLDGHNNPGFSGGPVVYAVDNKGPANKVAAVVSGFKFAWDQVYLKDQLTDLAVKYNTGIVIAYSIEHAMELIHANPIGAKIA